MAFPQRPLRNAITERSVSQVINELDIGVHNKQNQVRPTLTFKCDSCDFKSATKISWYRHRREHYQVKCPYCSFQTGNKGKFNKHIELHYAGKPFRCHKCKFVTGKERDLISHRRIHFGTKPHYCPFCKATFKGKHNLGEHVRKHTGEKPFACPDCHLAFSIESSVIRHQEGNRCARNFRTFNQSTVIPTGLSRPRKFIYGSDRNLVHKVSVGGNKNDRIVTEGNNDANAVLQMTECENIERVTEVSKVQKSTPPIALTKHVRIPALVSADALIQLTGPNEKLSVSAKEKLSELVDQERSSVSSKPFACPMCTYSFSGFERLNQHIRTHTGERPYACAECSYAAPRKDNLERHFRNMHSAVTCYVPGSTMVKNKDHWPAVRNTCKSGSSELGSETKLGLGKSNTVSKAIVVPVKKLFVCEFCDSEESTAFGLLDHLRNHTGQTLYKCRHYGCDFKTVDKKLYYDVHLRTHSSKL